MPFALPLNEQMEKVLSRITLIIAAAQRENRDDIAQAFISVRQYIYKHISEDAELPPSITKPTPTKQGTQ